MTYLIDNWQTHANVHSLQTTNLLDSNQFDIHPNHSQDSQLKALASQFNLPHTPKFLKQIHGNKIAEYKESLQSNFKINADACFTRSKNVICTILTADCLPVLMTDSCGSFVAAVHCGWRSLYEDILSHTIERINPNNELLVYFGPCIQQDQYEVGADFVENYLQKHPTSINAFTPIKNGKSQASLYEMAKTQLNNYGISNISLSNECTFIDDKYYSWRKTQTFHRMSSMIWLT